MQALLRKHLVQRGSHHWLMSWHDSRPVPYDCVVKPRFAEVESILAEERERFGI